MGNRLGLEEGIAGAAVWSGKRGEEVAAGGGHHGHAPRVLSSVGRRKRHEGGDGLKANIHGPLWVSFAWLPFFRFWKFQNFSISQQKKREREKEIDKKI